MNKSEIFKKAWVAAKTAAKRHSESVRVVFGSVQVENKGVFLKASEFFAECLKEVYAALKRAAAHREAVKAVSTEPANSLNYSGARLSAESLAVIDMMQMGDRAPAYDAIEINA